MKSISNYRYIKTKYQHYECKSIITDNSVGYSH